jgi:hypothetical protein
MRTAIYARTIGTEPELLSHLRQIVVGRGETPVTIFSDDVRIKGKGKFAEWRRLLGELDQFDKIVLSDAGDLPYRTASDVLAMLESLAAHGVSVAVPSLGIDTSNGPIAVLQLVGVCRKAMTSRAIRRGQDKARAAGARIGRPPIPPQVRRRIVADLSAGAGVRPTARKYRVAPASVVTIKKSMAAESNRIAA